MKTKYINLTEIIIEKKDLVFSWEKYPQIDNLHCHEKESGKCRFWQSWLISTSRNFKSSDFTTYFAGIGTLLEIPKTRTNLQVVTQEIQTQWRHRNGPTWRFSKQQNQIQRHRYSNGIHFSCLHTDQRQEIVQKIGNSQTPRNCGRAIRSEISFAFNTYTQIKSTFSILKFRDSKF